MQKTWALFSFMPRAALLILIGIMLVDMMLGVFFRYVVGSPIAWTEEVGALSLIWLSFIGGAVGVRRGTHFSIHLLAEQSGPKVVTCLRLFVAGLTVLCGAILLYYGWGLTVGNRDSVTPALGLSLSVQYASSAVGGFLMICYSIGAAADALRDGRRI
jgi:TRAP-type C4-dicarboxylate transport system permease small subunit